MKTPIGRLFYALFVFACFTLVACEKQDDVINYKGDMGLSQHEYVDLGLPSGTLWATCNVGADYPDEYGLWFAWGETKAKDTYTWANYKYTGDTVPTSLLKYCSRADYGYNRYIDYLRELEPIDDAATVNWGGAWCTPTKEQWNELLTIGNCVWKLSKRNGVSGYTVTSKFNGESMFLPAAGIGGLDRDTRDFYGAYWSSTVDITYPHSAKPVYFYTDRDEHIGYFGVERFYGQSVRPVVSKKAKISK